MKRTPTASEVMQLRRLQGEMSAQAAGLLFDLGAETVRRIWRRETHRKVPDAVETPEEVGESVGRLADLLNQEPPEGEPDDNVPA